MKNDVSRVGLRKMLFYVAFSVLSASVMLDRSTLIELSPLFMNGVSIFVAGLLTLKIMLDEHKRRELLLDIVLVVAAISIELMGGPMFIVTSCLALLAMKEVNIRTVVKIDIAIKSFFLLSHAVFFLVDYLTGMETVWDHISYFVKGTAVSLYFRNPNTTGLIGTWIALDLLYLKNEKKLKDYIIPTIIVVAVFLTTSSRTPFLIYIVYLALQFIKDGKKLAVLQKAIYPMLCILAFLMVTLLAEGNIIYETLTALTSGRIAQSVEAYNLAGINILPSSTNGALLDQYIIDVFYVRCIVEYGIVTMLLYGLPYLFMPLKSSNENKRMAIIASVYLFFERAVANVGFAVPYLMIADAIYNREEKNEKK